MQINTQLVSTPDDAFSPAILIINNDEVPRRHESESLSRFNRIRVPETFENRGVPMSALND